MAQSECFQVLTTTGSSEEAATIAGAVVEERLAACVQVLGPVQSRYWWQGALETSTEWLCLAKTTAVRLDALMARIAALHSYDTPEITALPIVAGSEGYLGWIRSEVDGHGRA
jgi:periplasmic divalent cation tolerance protein